MDIYFKITKINTGKMEFIKILIGLYDKNSTVILKQFIFDDITFEYNVYLNNN